MQKIARHFLTRRLGRGTIKASVAADGSVSTELAFDAQSVEQQQTRLIVSPSSVKALTWQVMSCYIGCVAKLYLKFNGRFATQQLITPQSR